jgi:hypothetical protein
MFPDILLLQIMKAFYCILINSDFNINVLCMIMQFT